MSQWLAEVVCLSLIFVIPFICTLIPYKINESFVRKSLRGGNILSLLMCFGGGIFFATFIIHMAPEVRIILEEALIEPYQIHYPLADLIIGVGFLFVFFLDRIIMKFRKRLHKGELMKQYHELKQTGVATADDSTGGVSETALSNKSQTVDEAMENSKDKSPTSPEKSTENEADDATVDTSMSLADHAHYTRSIVLIVSISLHRIFEGMSIGIQYTYQNVWYLFLAVSCHEAVVGFGLGLKFVKNRFTLNKMIIAVFLCSMVIPVGVAIGTLIPKTDSHYGTLYIISGVLQGVATGTFIYATFFEILQEEITHDDESLSKFFSVFLGFVLLAALSAIPKECHDVAPVTTFINITTVSPLL